MTLVKPRGAYAYGQIAAVAAVQTAFELIVDPNGNGAYLHQIMVDFQNSAYGCAISKEGGSLLTGNVAAVTPECVFGDAANYNPGNLFQVGTTDVVPSADAGFYMFNGASSNDAGGTKAHFLHSLYLNPNAVITVIRAAANQPLEVTIGFEDALRP